MVCLVTDRHRLADAEAPLGPPSDLERRCLLAQVQYAVEAGIDLVQVRERDLEAAQLAALVRDLLALTRGSTTKLVVNDRIDVALACGADGVHLRGDSIDVAGARLLAPPGFLVGRSVHSVADAKASAEADYLIAGTVFPSASKGESAPLLGVHGLRSIVRTVRRPVLAIGGVDQGSIGEVASAGAAGFAAIGAFMAEGGACRAVPLHAIVAQLRQRFDTIQTAS